PAAAAAAAGGSSGGRCATTSNPEEGFTEDTIKIGTILPLSGALRTLGERVARVMERITEEYLPTIDHIEGPLAHLNWRCPERPGIFGRRIELEIFSLQANTQEEALAGMRRLIDVEKVFLVRDCYLQDSLMGPATQYQNAQGVPAVWCHFGGMPVPELAPWTFNPGIDPLTQAAIHTGYLFQELGVERLAVLADTNDRDTIVRVVQRVARHFGHPIPEGCIQTKRSQEAPNSMRSEVTAIRRCYGPTTTPDAVFAGDGLQAVFGALEAKRQGWRPADAGVRWVCTNPSCWVVSLAEICGDACEDMITDCATLPCVPWADPAEYPSVRNLRDVHRTVFPGEHADAVTYGVVSISSGIALWLTMVGPDLSREKFRQTLEGLRDWSSGIGPVITTGPDNHYGGQAQWLVRFTGGAPWFDDVSGDFITIQDVGVPVSLTRL
ncbi:MAG TPA: ABC transporter substrate-binding protein, partial [Actinomycetota bacterium]|nr:ABC transporter substrate-binding protein [Actinomycetota bacterium]